MQRLSKDNEPAKAAAMPAPYEIEMAVGAVKAYSRQASRNDAATAETSCRGERLGRQSRSDVVTDDLSSAVGAAMEMLVDPVLASEGLHLSSIATSLSPGDRLRKGSETAVRLHVCSWRAFVRRTRRGKHRLILQWCETFDHFGRHAIVSHERLRYLLAHPLEGQALGDSEDRLVKPSALLQKCGDIFR